jgi:hypothetical protein
MNTFASLESSGHIHFDNIATASGILSPNQDYTLCSTDDCHIGIVASGVAASSITTDSFYLPKNTPFDVRTTAMGYVLCAVDHTTSSGILSYVARS